MFSLWGCHFAVVAYSHASDKGGKWAAKKLKDNLKKRLQASYKQVEI